MAREKRSFTRIALNIPASISLYHMEFCHSGVIANISLSGCFFPFLGELPIGELGDLTITVGAGLETEIITLSGKIVRCDAEGVGINFTEYSPEIRRQLERIISSEPAN
jgi:hypothetical protein